MKRLLIVVDYQNDFVDGALGFAGAEKLEAPIAARIDEYRARGDQIAFTFDTHDKNYLQTQEGKNLPVEHCISGTDGHRLYGCLESKISDLDKQFEKKTFGSDALFEWLREANESAVGVGGLPFESIELVGLVSNICVVSNAVLAKTACPEVPIIVDAACTASFDAAMNEKVLDVLQGLQVQVTNRA